MGFKRGYNMLKLIDRIADRFKYIKMYMDDASDIADFYQERYAMKYDKGTLERKNKWHYKFDMMRQEDFTNFVLAKISVALKNAQKVQGISLFHANATDEGMNLFLKALAKTKSPIKTVIIEDMPYVTDKSLSILPEIIKNKGILNCKLLLPQISGTLKNKVNDACLKNQQLLMKKKEKSFER